MALEPLSLGIKASLSADKPIEEQYRRGMGRKAAAGGLLLLLLAAVAVLSLGVGSLSLSVREIITALFGQETGGMEHVVWNIRLPRTVGALVAGAGLGVAGVIMQNILRNPLASPFTIGISQGAAFGAAFAIIVLGAGQTHRAGTEAVTLGSPHIVVLSAFAGSLITVVFIMILSSFRRLSTESVILAGVALSAFFGASTMLLQYFAEDVQVAATVFWTFGDLGKAGWQENGFMFLAFVLPFSWFILKKWSFNTLQWGDDVAESLGVKVRRLRLFGMVLSSLTVSVVTAFLGIIGFVGLIGPHIVRYVVGDDYRFLIPFSALFGAMLLLLSDIIARTLMPPVILPVGIITSFAGAPLFLYLLMKGRRS